MKNTRLRLAVLLGLLPMVLSAQDRFRVVFYNTENTFDCIDDSLKNDDEYLPDGVRRWTPHRYWTKIEHLAIALAAAGETRMPDAFGLAEIENEGVLCDLLKKANLREDYRYVYQESPDQRGIDVCFAYNRFRFRLLDWQALMPVWPGGEAKKTRYVLHIHGLLPDAGDIHFFVCHWPSRYGGSKASEIYRLVSGRFLRRQCDSLLELNPDARIVIMGDFNDEPGDASLCQALGACHPDEGLSGMGRLFNLAWPMAEAKGLKSHKYQNRWSMLDQFIVSKSLVKRMELSLVDNDFLLMDDKKYLGRKPFRTYYGSQWIGGYSDHLPIRTDIPLSD